MMSIDRAERARAFLDREGWASATRTPLGGDASHRRYERLAHPERGGALLMDAAPALGENVAAFAGVTGLLRSRGVGAPEVYAADLADGFLVIEDLGDALYAPLCAADPAAEPGLYADAVDLLARIVAEDAPPIAVGSGAAHPLRRYDADALDREAALFVDWWLPAATGRPLASDARAEFMALARAACASVAGDTFSLVLRDYHAENLLRRPNRSGPDAVAPIDYQDALRGHPAYDLVSLLEDARRDVAPTLAARLIERFVGAAEIRAVEAFRADYAALGAQRNLKIIGIFARLWLRDGKPRYLDLIPRVWRHLQGDLAHPDLAPLAEWIVRYAPAPSAETLGRVRAAPMRPDPTPPPPPRRPFDTAMLLAAGLGTRMRPLTDTTPKPLLPVGGRALIDHAAERVREAGLRRVVVNLHHHAEKLRAHLGSWRGLEILLSDESARLLDTGGGVRHALGLIGSEAFLVLNSDQIWTDHAALSPLLEAWDGEAMDALLLLAPIERARAYTRGGDFDLGADGRLVRRRGAAPFVFSGAQALLGRAFTGAPDGAFSMNAVWDRAIAAGRAFGVIHSGDWIDVGTPEGLAVAERALGATGA